MAKRVKQSRPHVVIIGGGFGGLETARRLAKADVDITLIDRRNHHLFQPLLYQVATAGLASTDIASPIRNLLRKQDNATVLLASAERVDAERKVVVLDGDRELAYDHLVVAAGATNFFFGNDAWADHAPGLKSLEEALDIRRRVLLAYEAAEREPNASKRRQLLTFVVIGGGPTGVELAGALAEISRITMARNFRNFDPSEAHVILLEGGPRLLPALPEDLSTRARKDLEELGVEVVLGQRASKIDAHGVTAGDRRIATKTVLWGAGVTGAPIGKTLGPETDRGGRVPVDEDLTVPGCPDVYCIGDLAAFKQEDGSLVPGVAPAAMQMGRVAAENIVRTIKGEARRAFRYLDKGSMATIGRKRAVAVTGPLKLTGFMAWLAWLFVHLMTLVGFRNRLMVFMEWAWAYISLQRSARIILGDAVAEIPAPKSERFVSSEIEPRPAAKVDHEEAPPLRAAVDA